MSTGLGIDTTAECDNILARLRTLSAECYEGVPQGDALERDALGNVSPYRDVTFGSVVPSSSAKGSLASDEDDEPHTWTFQVTHTGSSKSDVRKLTQETDRTLIGWTPSGNTTQIKPYYYVQYESRNASGALLSYGATRFYETTIGVTAP